MFKINNDEIKLIIADMDGTLYSLDGEDGKNHQTNHLNKKWLQKAIDEKCYVVMNTGRLPFFMKWIVEELTGEINNFNKYFISCNGNLIHDFKSKQSWIENTFNKQLIHDIIDSIKDFDLVYDITSENGDYIYYSDKEFKQMMIDIQRDGHGDKYRKDLTEEIFNNISYSPKISMKQVKPKDKQIIIDMIEKKFKKRSVHSTWWSPEGVDLVLGETNKFNGIKNLLDIINKETNQSFNLNNVIYFGDNFNDMSVFDNLKYAIAVENAIPEIKAKAYEVSCNANDGALGYYLEKIWK